MPTFAVNTLKTIKSAIKITVWGIIAAYFTATIMLYMPFVQKWIGEQTGIIIENKLGTKVHIGKIRLGLLNRVVIDGFEVYDKDSKLMIRTARVAAKIDYGQLIRNGRIYISSAQIFGFNGIFHKADNYTKANYQFVLDSLASKDKSKESRLELSINSLIIRHGAIKYDKLDVPITPEKFNANHINIKDISAHLIIPYYTPDSIAVTVKKLAFKESSGLDLKTLRFDFSANGEKALLSNFNLSLPNTEININRVNANYKSKNGKVDIASLYFNGQIDKSAITLSDIGCFVPLLKHNIPTLYIHSTFNGTNKSINIDNLSVSSDKSVLTIVAKGYASKSSSGMRWFADINDLQCNIPNLIKSFEKENNYNNNSFETLTKFGNLKYSGTIAGNGSTISTQGAISSDAGNAQVRLRHEDKLINAYLYTNGINIGRLLDNDKLGMIATKVNIECDKGKNSFNNVKIDGIFPRIDYNGYSYTDITVNGVYNKQSLNGTINFNDPNGQIGINGNIGFDRNKQTIDLNATIRNLDLSAMNITDKWKGAKFDFDISADTYVNENEANLFIGRIGVNNFSMSSEEKEYTLDSLAIIAEPEHLTMTSDFGYAELTGQYNIKTLSCSFINMLHNKIPSFFSNPGNTNNKFGFTANIRKTDWLPALLNIPLDMVSPLDVAAYVDDIQGIMGMTFHTDKLYYNEGLYEDINFTAINLGDTLSVNGVAKKNMANGNKLNINLKADAANDKLATNIQWNNNQKKPVKGQLNAETTFIKNENGGQEIAIEVKPSQIVFNDTVWNVLPSNILYNSGDLTIDHFAIEHNKQHIRIDGIATKQRTDSITVDLQDVDVNYVLNLVNFHSVEFGGHLTGKAYVKSVFYDPDAYANLTVKNFTFEHGRLGKLLADVHWNKDYKQIDINAHADDTDGSRTTIIGYVSPAHNRIDLNIKAKDTNIEFLQSFCGSFMSDINARANGELRLHGPLNAINLTGEMVADGNVLITPINVKYSLSNDTIRFLPDNIVFKSDTIRDRNGNIGIVNGTLHHTNLSKLTYDINISTRNLLCYDTKSYGEDTFYGTAYGTGTCTIQGRSGRVDIDVNITPEKESFIEYNAASPEAIADQQFITWHDRTAKDSIFSANDSLPANHSSLTNNNNDGDLSWADIPSDIRINFLINMTPEATLRVLMDQNTNDYISLNGNGTIRATYFNKGTFDMFGTFIIDHGLYTLTIQNIIKKVFVFQKDGIINFNGDPYNAMLDLKAVYTVNSVPLSDLQLGNSFTSNNVRVDCLMNISGTPSTPRVDFNIDMPTVSEDAEQMVRTVINGEEEMNQQVVYLLSIGRFYMQNNNNSSETGQPNQTSLAMQSLLSGTISQQINSLLGSLVKNNNWTFGANISTGDEGFNNAEYEGLLSGRLLDNRLIINGQFGYRDNANATTSFIGDFDINYLLKPNGDVALKVYNQTNDRYFTKSSLNTQGIGLILKKDFNSIMELFGIKRKRKTHSLTLSGEADN